MARKHHDVMVIFHENDTLINTIYPNRSTPKNKSPTVAYSLKWTKASILC